MRSALIAGVVIAITVGKATIDRTAEIRSAEQFSPS
jgi:hypothetical protein